MCCAEICCNAAAICGSAAIVACAGEDCAAPYAVAHRIAASAVPFRPANFKKERIAENLIRRILYCLGLLLPGKSRLCGCPHLTNRHGESKYYQGTLIGKEALWCFVPNAKIIWTSTRKRSTRVN